MTNEYSFDEALQYDFNNGGKIFDQLKINLGSNDLPRFSCAAHKANIAVKMAINKNSIFSQLSTKLNKYSSCVRSSIKISKSHIQKK